MCGPVDVYGEYKIENVYCQCVCVCVMPSNIQNIHDNTFFMQCTSSEIANAQGKMVSIIVSVHTNTPDDGLRFSANDSA